MATSIGQAPLPPPVPASVNNIEGVDGIQGSADTALAMDASTHEVSRERRTILRRVRMAFGPGGSLQPFRLLNRDLRVLRGRYLSDWTIFNQLIFASAVFVFFTNLLPGITFAGDLYELTGKNYGTIEVVFSTGICGIIFSILCEESFHIPFLPFMAWSLIHAGWMHYLLAIFNAHDWTMQYITTFSTEIFSLLNSMIYFHKAVQEFERIHERVSLASFLYSIIGAVGTFLLAVFLSTAESWKPLFHRYIRLGLSEYAAAISIIIFIGIPNIGELATLDKQTLQVSKNFRPTNPDRKIFFVRFWELPVIWIFAAILPGLVITILFFFDHEISSIICTLKRYGIKKPSGFAWDIILLGTTTAICGVLGIPPGNGLIPQAPLHSESLMHTVDDDERPTTQKELSREDSPAKKPQAVYEQRWSHFLHAGGILVFMSPPLMHVLGLTPKSVLAGLFLFMGEQSLVVNPLLYRFALLLIPSTDRQPLPASVPNYRGIHLYTATQILSTVIIFIVSLTKAAPVFPVLIVVLVPVRLLLMNRFWHRETLRYVDAWACKDGTPEADEDLKRAAAAAAAASTADGGGAGSGAATATGQRRLEMNVNEESSGILRRRDQEVV